MQFAGMKLTKSPFLRKTQIAKFTRTSTDRTLEGSFGMKRQKKTYNYILHQLFKSKSQQNSGNDPSKVCANPDGLVSGESSSVWSR
jgi:hypothetical protein